jgi:IS5 family transposase
MQKFTLAMVGFGWYGKTTRRAAFFGEMDQVVPRSAWCALIEPVYPRPAMAVRRSAWSGCCVSNFCSSGLGREPAPDETTVCRFRHHRSA